MNLETDITRQFGLRYPIIQAPMAGGGDTPELVTAVAEAGGMGSIGAAYLSAAAIAQVGRSVRERTNRPFGINLFAPPSSPPSPMDPAPALDRVSPYYSELDLPPPEAPALPADGFDAQVEAALESGAAMFSFTFGIPPAETIAAIKARGMAFVATATTVEEATAIEAWGAEAVIAQGSEAGGHRATFVGEFEAATVGTLALVPQIVDAVSIPVIASGGIMDGRGIAAALALGAAAVQMGTAFLTCEEAGIPAAYKEAILAGRDHETRLTRAFSGRPARGIVNRFMTAIDSAPEDILPFPLQNSLTRPLRTAAGQQGRAEYLSLWAGQGLGLARRQPAGDLVETLVRETEATIAGLQASG